MGDMRHNLKATHSSPAEDSVIPRELYFEDLDTPL